MMSMISFFVTYLLFLLASSITITAFFCITRGYIYTAPDGSRKREGKILKGYYFFWFKEKGKRMLQYKDDELAELVQKMKPYYSEPITLVGDPFIAGSITTFCAPETIRQLIPLLRKKLEITIKSESTENDRIFLSAWSEVPVYFFPEW